MQPLTQIKSAHPGAEYIVKCRALDGSLYTRERNNGETCWSTTIADIISGEIEDPVSVTEVIVDEHWSADVTEKACQEIADRFAKAGDKIDPDRQRHLLEWVGQTLGVPAMLALEAA